MLQTREIVVNGRKFTVTGVLLCRKCTSRMIEVDWLVVDEGDGKVEGLIFHCLRCDAVFMVDFGLCDECGSTHLVVGELFEPYATIARKWFKGDLPK